MFVGAITRDSVRQALVAGITADQMVAYLRLNALPMRDVKRERKSLVFIYIVYFFLKKIVKYDNCTTCCC